ncbi:MAG: short-chain dehydrogenase [Legionellales bacterium]|nr:short-chain dehydrogenase [Legionellales bacterium]
MMNLFDLDGKTAIITGGAGILGQGFCQLLAEYGANVAIVDIDLDMAEKVAEKISKNIPAKKLLPLACDISDYESINNMLGKVIDRFNAVHILHNNAATKTEDYESFFESFEDYKIETWREVMRVNIDGMFLTSQVVGKKMIEQECGGSIINTASIYGVVGPDHRIYNDSEYLGVSINTPAVYSTSKAAVIGFTKHMATYWARHNIRVNALTPGGIESGQNQNFKNNYSDRVPLGRMGKINELDGALLYLASDASSYVTGQNIIVDGGLTCW